MKRKINKLALLAVAGVAAFSSCSRDMDFYNPNATAEEYAKNWEEKFGTIDAEQDWNAATQVTANVDLQGLSGASTVEIYTAVPGGSHCELVASYPASTTSFKFDYPKGSTDAYVVVKNSQDGILYGAYNSISNSTLNVSTTTKAATRADDACPVTLGDKYTSDELGTFNDNDLHFDYLFHYEYDYSRYARKRTDIFDMYKLNNATQLITSSSDIYISDIAGIVGKGGVFNERGNVDKGGVCNLVKWEEDLKPSEGVVYGVAQDGPVNLTYFYYGTGDANPLGYFYYKDGATIAEIARAPRYVITEKSTGSEYIKVNGESIDYANLAGKVNNYTDNNVDGTITTANIQLVYFGENGTDTQGTYTFPKGTKIGFFLSTSSGMQNIRYSLPELNQMFYYNQTEKHSDDDADNVTKPWQMFITYKWGGKVIMGVEDDGGDDDVNDLLFVVDNVESSSIPEIGETPEEKSWTIACEDLGDTDDYDFNDVVLKMSYVAGTNKTVSITPMAAGGVKAINVKFNGEDLGEIHKLINGTEAEDGSYPMLNTTSKGTPGTTITRTVTSAFSMTEHGISLSVKNGENTVEITKPQSGTAPQMLVIDKQDWAWPTERTGIETAYPDFTKYVTDSSYESWYNNPTAGKVVE